MKRVFFSQDNAAPDAEISIHVQLYPGEDVTLIEKIKTLLQPSRITHVCDDDDDNIINFKIS